MKLVLVPDDIMIKKLVKDFIVILFSRAPKSQVHFKVLLPLNPQSVFASVKNLK